MRAAPLLLLLLLGCASTREPVAPIDASPGRAATAAIAEPPPSATARPTPDVSELEDGDAPAPVGDVPVEADVDTPGATAARRDGCVETPSGADPTCLWRRFERVRARRDARATVQLVLGGCPEPAMARALARMARAPLVTLRRGAWIHDMWAHCAAEIPDCHLSGSIEGDGEVFEIHVNHEGIGSVRQHEEWSRFALGGGGGCGD